MILGPHVRGTNHSSTASAVARPARRLHLGACGLAVNIWGFPSWGHPIAGWFLLGKIPSRNGWERGVPPFQETTIFQLNFGDPSVVGCGESGPQPTELRSLAHYIFQNGVCSQCERPTVRHKRRRSGGPWIDIGYLPWPVEHLGPPCTSVARLKMWGTTTPSAWRWHWQRFLQRKILVKKC